MALSSHVGVLEEGQKEKLLSILTTNYEIPGGSSLPTLSVRALDFTLALRDACHAANIPLVEVRLNGSAASYVVSEDVSESMFNDLDILFMLAEPEEGNAHEVLENVRRVFFRCLFDLLPDSFRQATTAQDAFFLQGYIQKMFKVPSRHGYDADCPDVWSLITLNSSADRNLEFKFVMKLRRAFEFSVDSVQITLDVGTADEPLAGPVHYTALYGSVDEVLRHLRNREIAISSPELVRGGGLLKYCYLRAQGYMPTHSGAELAKLELYMCNRFLIDFTTNAAISMTCYNYFIVRLYQKDVVSRAALLQLRDLVVRHGLGDVLNFIGVIEALLASLPEPVPLLSDMPPLSSLHLRVRNDSPTSSIDSHASLPTDGSSSGCDTPARPWGGRPFAAVAALPPRLKASPLLARSSPPTTLARPPPSAAASPARGSSAPASPIVANKAVRRKSKEPSLGGQSRAAYLESQFPALSRARGPRS